MGFPIVSIHEVNWINFLNDDKLFSSFIHSTNSEKKNDPNCSTSPQKIDKVSFSFVFNFGELYENKQTSSNKYMRTAS